VVADDAMGRFIFKRGVLDPENTSFLQRFLKLNDGDVVLDIGANIGWYSLLIDRLTQADVRIFAFEPDRANYDLLVENVALNKATRVQPVRKAVSERIGTQTLYLYGDKNTGRHSLLPLNEAGTEEVETTTLDAFLTEANVAPSAVKFIKFDIEGYEQFALAGATRLLGTVPFIFMEYTHRYLQRLGIEPSKQLDLMYGHGYVPYLAHADGTLTAVEKKWAYGPPDWQPDFLWKLERSAR
jgi:FkbM family methyltransferase